MVDVILRTVVLVEPHELAGRRGDIPLGEGAGLLVDIDAQLLVELETAHQAEVVAPLVLEHLLEEGAGIGDVRRVAGAHPLVDLPLGVFAGLGGVALEALDEVVADFVGVDQRQLLDSRVLEDFEDAGVEGFQRVCQDGLLVLRVEDVLNQGVVRGLLLLDDSREALLLDAVDCVENLPVAVIAEGAQEDGDDELAAAALAVQVDVHHVLDVELDFQPGTVVGQNLVAVDELAAGMVVGLEADAGGTVELADDDALAAVDDEGAAGSHQGQVPKADALLVDVLAGGALHAEGDVEVALVGAA